MEKKVFTKQEVRNIVRSCVDGMVKVLEIILPESDGNVITVSIEGDITSRELAAMTKKFGDEGICVSGDGYGRLVLFITPTVSDQEG